MSTSNETDPLGHELFKKRMNGCQELIEGMLKKPLDVDLDFIPHRYIITGIGSSEASGRFLKHLINHYTTATADFWPISHFITPVETDLETTLIVISQGLSPNAHIPLAQQNRFRKVILFTSVTPKTASEEDLEVLEALKSKGHTIVTLPPESEGDLLIRAQGPMAYYLGAIQFVQSLWPDSIPQCDKEALMKSFIQAKEESNTIESFALMRERDHGYAFISSWPMTRYIHNLQYKLMEGAMARLPPVFDWLGFCHGGFQQFITNPPALIIFQGNTPGEDYLSKKATPLLDMTGCLRWNLKTELPNPWNIFYYEMVMNYFIAQTIEHYEINQRHWPGQAQDTSLYKIKEPYNAQTEETKPQESPKP